MTVRTRRARRGLSDKVARKLVQVGLLVLLLYPLLMTVLRRLNLREAPLLTSWLLPWDPLLLLGQTLQGNWRWLVLGAPLLTLALGLLVGRAFCGWVCPVGTLLDLVRPLARWQRSHAQAKRGVPLFPATRNSPLRYYLLIGVSASAVFSLHLLGLLDPLVFFQRTGTTLVADAFSLQRATLRLYLAAPLLFLAILGLELWQPRFWCRHLCPLGTGLGLVARWGLLRRRVGAGCSDCGQCQRYCPMKAIPAQARATSYQDCHLCLGCESVCPRNSITFGWGPGRQPQPAPASAPSIPPAPARPALPLGLSRRQLLGGAAAGVAGLALTPVLRLEGAQALVRPPGALPEQEFLAKCITCQECVRVCPTGGLMPAFLEAGLAGIGTPQLLPRQGGCNLNPSCPQLCAQVCPVGAIRLIRKEEMRIGRARVVRSSCLAWDQGVKCLVCVEACPTGAAVAYRNRVTVDPNRCTGCGRCEHVCPVAGAAIHVDAWGRL